MEAHMPERERRCGENAIPRESERCTKVTTFEEETIVRICRCKER